MTAFAYLYDATGGVNSFEYRRAKTCFERVYSDYRRRAGGIREFHRQEAENQARDEREERTVSLSPEPERGQEKYSVEIYDDYEMFIDAQPSAATLETSEIDRWLADRVLKRSATAEKQRIHMQSRQSKFPIICQMARDFTAIPATSAPSERTFSVAGNLISEKRTRISSANVRAVLCLRSWGLVSEEDEGDEYEMQDGEYVLVEKS